MVYILRILFVLFLSGCVSAESSREMFLAGFKPSPQRIIQFDSANSISYKPRVYAHGIRAVNKAVNALPFVPDACEVHPIDPSKFWKHGGDCEEYALIKMLELRAQGINDTYFLVLADRADGRSHAVLVAEDRGRLVVLDNKTHMLEDLGRFYTRYRPIYMVEAATGRVYVAKP
jgi:predicted transglutaminase-like cysteine proteinase